MRRRVLAAANVIAWGLFAVDLLGDRVGPSRYGWDLAIVRAGGRLLLEGRPLYDAAEQARVHAEALRPELAKFPFAYPPITAIAAAPLSLVPSWLALAIVVAVGAAIVWLAAARLTGDGAHALWVTASFPGAAAFFSGQLAYVSFGIFAATYLLLKRDRPLAAGLTASLLAYKPTMLVAVPFALAVLPRRARALGGLVLGLFVETVLCLAVAPAATRAYPEAAMRFSTYVREHPERFDSVTWRASFAHFGPAGTALAVVAIAACGFGAVFWMWRSRRDLEVVFATALCATLACAWHCLPYDYILLALAAWLVIERIPKATFVRVALLVVIASWVVVPIVTPTWRAAVLALYPPAVVALSVWLLRAAREARASDRG